MKVLFLILVIAASCYAQSNVLSLEQLAFNQNVRKVLSNPEVQSYFASSPVYALFVVNGQVNWPGLISTPAFQALFLNPTVQALLLTGNATALMNNAAVTAAYNQAAANFVKENTEMLKVLDNPIIENDIARNPVFAAYVSNGQVNWAKLLDTLPFQMLLQSYDIQSLLLQGNATALQQCTSCAQFFNLAQIGILLMNPTVQKVLGDATVQNYFIDNKQLYSLYIINGQVNWFALAFTPAFQTLFLNPSLQALLLAGNPAALISSPIADAAFKVASPLFAQQNQKILNVLYSPTIMADIANNPTFKNYVTNGVVNWPALLATQPFQFLWANPFIMSLLVQGNPQTVQNSAIAQQAFAQAELWFQNL